MIEIFETNIAGPKNARIVEGLFRLNCPSWNTSIDVYERNPILRIDPHHQPINVSKVMEFVQELGFEITYIES